MKYVDYKPAKKERIKYYIYSSVGLFVVGILFYNSLIVAVILAMLSIPFERYYRRYLVEKYRQRMGVEFKDMLTSMSASFAAGRHMTEAVFEARDNLLLIFPNDSPINVELKDISTRLANKAEKERDILFDFAKRSQNTDIQSIVDVYYTCLTTGGDIINAVNRATEIIIDKMSIRRELETLTAQKKFEAKILTFIPLVILFFLRINSPDYLDSLYGNPLGIIIMTIAIICLGISFVWSNKIMDVKV